MGEARRRGTREQRKAKAIARFNDMRPNVIECEKCGKALHNVQHLDVQGHFAIETAFDAMCTDCNFESTVLIFQTPELQQLWDSLDPEQRSLLMNEP